MGNKITGQQLAVYDILVRDEASRNDDSRLYYLYCKDLGVNMEAPIRQMLLNRKDYPNYEAITRVRRKVQELFPITRADDNVAAGRELKEEEYRREYGCAMGTTLS